MNNKLLEEQDLALMPGFVDDEKTEYKIEDLNRFIADKNNLGFIARDDKRILAFAFGYVLTHPDGEKVFYLDAIDVIKEVQGRGIGTDLMSYVRDHVRSIGCREMFLFTNQSNSSARKCYERSGAIKEADDAVLYVYSFE